MLYSTQIRPGLFLVEQIINQITDCEMKRRPPAHEIILIDDSGSTMGFNSRMRQHVAARVKAMAKRGAILSYGWFSGVNECDWIVRGANVATQEQMILTAIERHRPKFNLTCFSQILQKTETLIDELSGTEDNPNLFFLTDGNDNQKVAEVLETLSRLAPRIRVSKIVGYSDWIDRERLSKMAAALNAEFVHADDIEDFETHFANFEEAADNAQPKVEVMLQKGEPEFGAVFTLTNGAVEMIETLPYERMLTATGPVLRSPRVLVSEAASAVYYFSKEPVGSLKTTPEDMERSLPSLYAAARTLLQLDRPADALEVMGAIGDINIANRINNSFTVAEYGKIEGVLQRAVYAADERFIKGRQPGCVPKRNAFCLFDLIELLINDDDVAIAVSHPAMKYKPKGRGSVVRAGYPPFKRSNEVMVPFNGVIFHKSELNISFSFQTPGIVELDEDAPKYGFSQSFKTKKWSARSLVADAKRNILRLPLANVKDSLLQTLTSHGIVISNADGIVVLDLTQIPIVNRQMAESYTNLDTVCGMMWTEKVLEAENKVVGSLFNQLPEDMQERVKVLVSGTVYTDEQIAYLAKFGINAEGVYDPPTDPAPTTDVKTITTVEFEIENFGSLPSLNDITAKLAKIASYDPNAPVEKGKRKQKKPELTPREELMVEPYKAFHMAHGKESEAQRAVVLRERRKTLARELAKLRREMHMFRFATTIGKVPFDQVKKLTERTEHVYNDLTYIIKVVEKEVEI